MDHKYYLVKSENKIMSAPECRDQSVSIWSWTKTVGYNCIQKLILEPCEREMTVSVDKNLLNALLEF